MIRVHNVTRDRRLADRAEEARTFGARLRGLIGRRSWGEADGLWIEPCGGVHSFGMAMTIDVVLVDEALRVLRVETLRPFRLGRLHLEARAALELPEGLAARTGTLPGDQLQVVTETASKDRS